MAVDYSQTYAITDSPTANASPLKPNGESYDDDEIEWDDVETVTIDNPQWTEFFGTDTFKRIEYTVARPIEQRYVVGDDEYTFVKPRSELKKAQWSLDNRPWTLTHPPNKHVTDTSQIHGFFRNPRYLEETDEQRIYGYLPINDTKALDYVSQNPEISVGFRSNFVTPTEYDGTIGGNVDSSVVDAYQTDIYYDHIASGKNARCSLDDGCGPVNDTDTTNQMIPLTSMRGVDDISTTMSKSGADSEDVVYGVKEDEASDGPKYPLETCNDVRDAYNLRNNGEYDIATETLVERIQRRASQLDCPNEYKPWVDSTDSTDTMTDCDCGGNDDLDFSALEKLGADTIASNNEDVAALQERVDELEATVDTLESDLEEAESQRDAATDKVETLNDTLSEYEKEKFDEKVDTLTDLTDYWEEDALRESFDEGNLTTDTMDERIDLAREMGGDDTQTDTESESESEATETTISTDTTETDDLDNDEFDGTFIN